MCNPLVNLEPFNISGGIPMTRADLVKKMAEEAGITKKAAASALTSLVGAIHDSLKKKEGKIRIADLGTFKVIKKKARTGVNPQTRQKIKIAAAKVPRFSASKALKDAVKKTK
jgi:DNA-binding protein HU-beta